MFGVFIGLQVNNWNAERADRATERAIIERLAVEFQYQATELETLTQRLCLYKESARSVIIAIKEGERPENREQFQEALFNTLNRGRPSARSATYVQLFSSGELDLLANESLRDLLVRYDQKIERNNFLFEQTLGLLLSTSDFVAATGSNFREATNTPGEPVVITDFDFNGLKS